MADDADQSHLPDPPVPNDLNLRDFKWMKLDLSALFNSDFNLSSNDRAWRVGVTLWCRSWHQIPAGSLPNDDRRLRILCGMGLDNRSWMRVKKDALHGWKLHSDGRLYHRFVSASAIEAMELQEAYERRKSAARERKRAWRERTENEAPSTDAPPIVAPMSRGSNGDVTRDGTRTSRVTNMQNDTMSRVTERGSFPQTVQYSTLYKEEERIPYVGICVAASPSDRTAGEPKEDPPCPVPAAKPRADAGNNLDGKNEFLGLRMTEDWQPRERDRAFAVKLGLDADEIVVEFRNYWLSVPGKAGRKLRWSLVWQNRCLELAKRKTNGIKPNAGAGIVAAAMRVMPRTE